MSYHSAVIGFSYGGRCDGPGISNETLIQRLKEKFPYLYKGHLILQSELALCIPRDDLAKMHTKPFVIREHRAAGQSLDSYEVAAQAVEHVLESNYYPLYILAYPFLQRPLCVWLVRSLIQKYNTSVVPLSTGWIPSDPASEKWWTRHPLYTAAYTAWRACTIA